MLLAGYVGLCCAVLGCSAFHAPAEEELTDEQNDGKILEDVLTRYSYLLLCTTIKLPG